MRNIHLRALAKINLGLDVTGRRPDGYHEVRMVMQTINLSDQIELIRTREPGIRARTNLYFLPVDARNLAYRAADLMIREYGIKEGVHINARKNIPVAAGLAGGSADAAATLFGMNRLFGLGASMDELARIGLKLGADVPFCVYRGTMLAEGIGEELSALPSMPKCFILLAKPSFSVSTKTVYERFDKLGDTKPIDIDGVIEALGERNLDKLTRSVGNALEYVTATEYPVITDIKTIMLKAGAIGALMSGSGPTVFGIFRERSAAAGAERAIRGAKLAKQIYITTPYNTKHGS